MALFQDGEFTAHAGGKLSFKFECDDLSDESIETIAAVITRNFTFSEVLGIPQGGCRLAEALEKHCSSEDGKLVVDDVYTTGKSMREAREEHGEDALYIVIFARSQPPPWVKTLLTLSEWAGP